MKSVANAFVTTLSQTHNFVHITTEQWYLQFFTSSIFRSSNMFHQQETERIQRRHRHTRNQPVPASIPCQIRMRTEFFRHHPGTR